MRGSLVVAAVAGLAFGGVGLSGSANAGVFSSAARADLHASPVVDAAWWGNLFDSQEQQYTRQTWRELSRDDRHALRLEWKAARHAAKHGDNSLMTALMSKYSGSSSTAGSTGFTSGSGSSGTGSTGSSSGVTSAFSTSTTGSGSGSTGGTSSFLGSLSTTTVSYTSATSALDPTARQAGGLPGSNYLALPTYGVTSTTGTINLSSGLMTSWLEHSTLLAGFDANGNVTFEPLKAGAHIIGVIGGTNIKSISFGPNNAISFSLIDPTKDGDFSYILGFADGSTRTVNGNPIYVQYSKLFGNNFQDFTSAGTTSFSIPFSEIFANFSNPNAKNLKIAGIGVSDGVSNLFIDYKNQVVTGTLTNGQLGRLGITVTDGFTADTITKTIKFTASPV